MAEPKIIDTALMSRVYNNIPPKLGNKGPALNDSILRGIRVMDEQDAVNRFRWYNLPIGLNQNLMERILYYRGSAMFFYMKENNTFYFLPYVGSHVDVYGRYVGASALPFNGTTATKDERPWIEGKSWECQYDIILPEDLKEKDLYDKCVLINDYSKQMSQKVLPRVSLQEPLLQVESELIPFMRTALLNQTGISGMKVQSSDEAYSVQQASNSLNRAALLGDKWIPVEAGIQTEELTGGASGRAEEFFLAMQSLDNLRLSFHGLENGGLFEKKAHTLQSEEDINQGTASIILQDCLWQRQTFCNIVNSIWGLGIWVEPSEVTVDADMNGDGLVEDEQEPNEGQEQEGRAEE